MGFVEELTLSEIDPCQPWSERQSGTVSREIAPTPTGRPSTENGVSVVFRLMMGIRAEETKASSMTERSEPESTKAEVLTERSSISIVTGTTKGFCDGSEEISGLFRREEAPGKEKLVFKLLQDRPEDTVPRRNLGAFKKVASAGLVVRESDMRS